MFSGESKLNNSQRFSLHSNTSLLPSKFEKEGSYEKAAKAYEDLKMWEKAYKCLKKKKH